MIYAYCYLNFIDDESKAAYVKAVVDGADTGAAPTAYDIKTEMLDRMEAYKDKLTVKVGNASTRLYANGAVLNYEGNNLTVTDPSTYTNSGAFASYSANLYKRYRMLDTYLDSMADVPLSATDTKNIDKQDFEDDAGKLPAGRFFWLWGMDKAVGGSGSIKAADADAEKQEFGSNFIYVKSESEVDLASELSGSNPHRAFVIIDGDAKVTSDVTIQGFLVCTGKLTVKKGKELSVTYDSTLLNKRIEKELKKLIDNAGFHDGTAPDENTAMKNLLIYYLLNEGRSFYGGGSSYKLPAKVDDLTNAKMKDHPDYREYKFIEGTTSNSSLDLNTDYSNFVYFENWKKGQR